ncbi:hypothetical protein N431DRAFT_466268 [Stipitochalara longipes BDJ]|nr:hypothetical protein N431DRAFT_466268 [Stipitochalara longipes BDJ]
MTNRPEVDWNIVAKKVGYNTAETAKARFRQMKRKFNDVHSDGSLDSPPSKAQIPAFKVTKNTTAINNRSPAKLIKPMPLPARAKNNKRKKASGVKRNAKRTKMEKVEVGNDADGEMDNSVTDSDHIESE